MFFVGPAPGQGLVIGGGGVTAAAAPGAGIERFYHFLALVRNQLLLAFLRSVLKIP